MITVDLLADHLETVPILADWFRAQWPDYFAGWTETAVRQSFQDEATRHGIPLRLVAFVDGTLAGTVVLRERAVGPLPDYRPGLGGLFVAAPYRRRGVGSALVSACMAVARAQGHPTLYAGTVAAQGLLERLGWELVDWKVIAAVPHGEERLALYRCLLGTP